MGLESQFSHLSIALHLATVETMGVAFPYGRLVKAYLAGKALSREELAHPLPVSAAINKFSRILSTAQPQFLQQALSENPRTTAAPKREPKPKKAAKTPKGAPRTTKTPAWASKRKRSVSRVRSVRRGRSPRKAEHPAKRRKENATNPRDAKKRQ